MKTKGYFAAIFGVVLAAAVFLAGCENLTTSPDKKENSNSGELDGTWKRGSYEIIIDGDSYIMKYNGNNYGKGTISYSVGNSTFSFRSTHEWTGSSWSPSVETTNGNLTYGGTTLVISNLDNYIFLAGTWTKQTGSGTGTPPSGDTDPNGTGTPPSGDTDPNGTGTPPSGDTDPKSIVITGFPGSTYSGKMAIIMLYPSIASLAEEEISAVGGTTIGSTSNKLTIPLKTDQTFKTDWKETGEYFILLAIGTAEKVEKTFVYSNTAPNENWTNISRYLIKDTESTILFSSFYDITEQGTTPSGNTDPKSIVITGFPGNTYSGKMAIIILYPSIASLANEETSAVGAVSQISGTTLTFPLYRDTDLTTRWNGTGDYIVVLGIADSEGEVEKMFFYSNGAQINSNSTDVPRYSITETTSSIAYNLFYDMTTYMRLSQNFSFGKATLKFAVLQD